MNWNFEDIAETEELREAGCETAGQPIPSPEDGIEALIPLPREPEADACPYCGCSPREEMTILWDYETRELRPCPTCGRIANATPEDVARAIQAI